MTTEAATPATAPAAPAAKFGTFKGVFTPSILTILGVIMYLRFGWVVGHAGLVGTIFIVLLAHVVSVTTGLSISSIATNRTVKAGGDYYMISRSLGMPLGGALGVALFFALALSMSLYVLGFAESLLDAFGMEDTLLARRVVGTVATVLLTALTFWSTSLALKLQFFVLAAIGLSLLSLFAGRPPQAEQASQVVMWFGEGSEDFGTLFAVFFPAVTGFTAGVAMSGDLASPRRAIPRGTMGAILVGLGAYLVIPVFFATTVSTEALRTDKMIWMRVAFVPSLVVAGVFAATLSSALGSVLGAPRYLQALASDGVAPRLFARGHGPLNEPRIATIATFAIAEAGVLVGELDVIARVITMFFLTSYGFLCLACGVQTWSGIASFRPSFKTPAWVSFLGAATCLGLMFKLDATAMAVSIAIMAAIFAVLKRRELSSGIGDTWGGFWAAVVQAGILRLHRRAVDTLNWRPNALVFGGLPSERQYLIHFTRWLFEGRGLGTYIHIVQGDIRDRRAKARQLEAGIREVVSAIWPDMLSRVLVSRDLYGGMRNVAQSYGLAGMVPNTVLLGWADESEVPAEFIGLLRDLAALEHNLMLLHHDPAAGFGQHRLIDIWWSRDDHHGAWMLLLAYLLTSSDRWSHATVRLLGVVDDPAQIDAARAGLEGVLERSRLKAVAHAISRAAPEQTVTQALVEASREADLAIVPLDLGAADDATAVARISEQLGDVQTVLLVHASSRFDARGLMADDDG